ncbi:alkaline phosphatase family protein [Pontibacter sp. BAB1700]|uniref:alkaline phosphatase family protein n=1 Tax=Pontibacter sp. BAB1700 TaxID=1144253 RepID=UPI0008FB623D|nr:alkaline phosphatase family protein [Pontibacter sp. BAB1700]
MWERWSRESFRRDTLTFDVAKSILETHRPNLVLINLLEPDVQGHLNNWPKYLKGITASDRYVWQLWNFIQQDSHYKDKTALLITNDHGRHPDGHLDSFVSHGDGCESCRRISLLALGPDFKKGKKITDVYEQVDIPTTVAELMGFSIPNTQGRVFKEAFR